MKHLAKLGWLIIALLLVWHVGAAEAFTQPVKVKVILVYSDDPNDEFGVPIFNVGPVKIGPASVFTDDSGIARAEVSPGSHVVKIPSDVLTDETGRFRVGFVNVHRTAAPGAGTKCAPNSREGDVAVPLTTPGDPNRNSHYEVGIRVVPLDAPPVQGATSTCHPERTEQEPEPPCPPSQQVTISNVRGEVELLPGGAEDRAMILREGDTVCNSDRLYTGLESSVTMTFGDGAVIDVEELTDMRIAAFRDEGDRIETRILLKAGEIAASVNEGDLRISDFSVQTPAATAGVRGTTFTIRHDEATQQTQVTVGEGTVEVIPKNSSLERVTATTGDKVHVTPTSVDTEDTAVPPPPSGGNGSAAPLEMFDTNDNNRLDDVEFLDVIDAWIDQQVSDSTFFEAMDAWISGAPLAGASLGKTLDSLRATTSERGVTFAIAGYHITDMQVDVYDLSGQSLVSLQGPGPKLAWKPQINDGPAPANGVYLAIVTVREPEGAFHQQALKFMLQR